MKRASLFQPFFIGIIGCIGLVFLARYIISSKSFPSLDEFMASSTAISASSTEQVESTDMSNESSSNVQIITDKLYATTTIRTLRGDIHALIADTTEKRTLGLSGRASLATTSGMLFVFDQPGTYGFWMKDMFFPIDIVLIGVDKRVVDVSQDITPETFPKTFFSSSDSMYVLELNAGMAEKFGLKKGSTLIFDEIGK